MTAMTQDRKTQYTEGVEIVAPVGIAKTIYAGGLVVLDGTTKHAEEASDASGKVFHGVAMEQADNSGGLGGAINIRVRRRGLFLFKIAAALQADVGKPVFALYGDEVALSTGVTYAIMVGQIAALESATKVWVDISFALNPTDVATHIADASAAHAASAISILDSGNFTTASQVEAALAEIYQHLKSIQAFIPIPLTAFRELAAGVFINAAGNGGILAIDTTPILSMIADGDAMRLAWATGNADQIAAQVILPPDIDVAANMVVHMLVSKDGNTDNACHLDGEAYFGESDSDCFPAAGASNLTVADKTELTATIALANLPATQVDYNMTLVLMPETHANDVVYLHGVWIEYKRKLLTS